jgi:ribonucleoside-diphosphate reductase subunit M1
LNNVIDINCYPTPQSELSNNKHRPIGIGVQGLADTFMKMGIPFGSEEAKKLNIGIFQCIYYNSLRMSCVLSKEHGH